MGQITLCLWLATLPPAQQLVPPQAVPILRPRPAVIVAQPVIRSPTPTAAAVSSDDQLLQAAHLSRSGPVLLDFFRQRTPPGPPRAHLVELIQKLSDVAAVSDPAVSELVRCGQAAVPLLREAANNVDDRQGSRRARECLGMIEGGGGANLALAVVRALAVRKPSGMVAVLLAYLPFAEDDRLVEEIEAALVAAGERHGKTDPALLHALKDPSALRRASAAAVLCQLSNPAAHTAVRRLLRDDRPSVRLRAALGLCRRQEAESIPVLIELLAELPSSLSSEAEKALSELAGEWAVSGPSGKDHMSRQLRRAAWAAWWTQLDGARLLEEVRAWTLSDTDRERVLELIGKLEDPSSETRARALSQLRPWGAKILPLLRQTVQRRPESGGYAAKYLETLEKETPTLLPDAALRLLALRRPTGTVAALLAYLPFADKDRAAQIPELLALVGCGSGEADPDLLRALQDRLALRRAAAVTALCKGNAQTELPAMRPLLQDADPVVRLHAALGLAGLQEKDAVPVLINLLAELPPDQTGNVEEYLTRLAGKQAPDVTLGGTPQEQAHCRDVWKSWWREHGASVNLAQASTEVRRVGYLLVVETHNPSGTGGRVLEVDVAGKVRWEIGNLQFPMDAQLLPNGNVLVLERNQTITERDRKGNLVRQHSYPGFFAFQRLRNGHLFLVSHAQLLEVDAAGKTVSSIAVSRGPVLLARKFPDGQAAYITYSGEYVRFNAAGKEIKRTNLPFAGLSISGIDLLPRNRILVSVLNASQVLEYTAEGKMVWKATVSQPGQPYRLPNGHILVPSQTNNQITELDAAGKVVAERKNLPYRPFRIHER